jgi:hypothetical protein
LIFPDFFSAANEQAVFPHVSRARAVQGPPGAAKPPGTGLRAKSRKPRGFRAPGPPARPGGGPGAGTGRGHFPLAFLSPRCDNPPCPRAAPSPGPAGSVPLSSGARSGPASVPSGAEQQEPRHGRPGFFRPPRIFPFFAKVSPFETSSIPEPTLSLKLNTEAPHPARATVLSNWRTGVGGVLFLFRAPYRSGHGSALPSFYPGPSQGPGRFTETFK